MGTRWAEVKDILPEADLHTRGTIRGSGGKLIFWLRQPRPKGVSVDDWEALQQEKWDKIFGAKEKS